MRLLPRLGFMASKILTLISIVGLAGMCAINAQSPTPSGSPSESPSLAKHRAHKKAEISPSPAAESTASASPAKQRGRKTSPASTSATKAATNATPAPGGGHGLVWVNTETHVYHKEGSRFYGTTKKGKYMSEAEAVKEGDRAAKGGE